MLSAEDTHSYSSSHSSLISSICMQTQPVKNECCFKGNTGQGVFSQVKGFQGNFQLITSSFRDNQYFSLKMYFQQLTGNDCSYSEEKCILYVCLDSTSDPCNEAQAQAGWDLDGFQGKGGWVKGKCDRKDMFSIHEQLRRIFPVSQPHLRLKKRRNRVLVLPICKILFYQNFLKKNFNKNVNLCLKILSDYNLI